jgi:hypothetical protein
MATYGCPSATTTLLPSAAAIDAAITHNRAGSYARVLIKFQALFEPFSVVLSVRPVV